MPEVPEGQQGVYRGPEKGISEVAGYGGKWNMTPPETLNMLAEYAITEGETVCYCLSCAEPFVTSPTWKVGKDFPVSEPVCIRCAERGR